MMREIVSCPSSSVLGLKGAPLAVAFILLSFGLSLVSKRRVPSGKMPLLFTYDSFDGMLGLSRTRSRSAREMY